MDIKAIVFDLGGVLIDVVSAKRLSEIIGDRMTLAEVARRWSQSTYVNLYESGRCDQATFADGVIKELDMSMEPQEFLEEFKLFLRGFYPGAAELLREIPAEYTLACLTDTNETQWASLCKRTGIDQYFRHHFLSYQIGHVKPDQRIYRHVIERLNSKPEEIVYFDDNARNVQAGLDAGMRAYQVAGVGELKAKLEEIGIR